MGDPLSFIHAGLRDGVGKSISGFIFGIGFLIAFLRSDRLALHDLMFGTEVVGADLEKFSSSQNL